MMNQFNEIPLEDVEFFYNFLQGKATPEGIFINHPPHMTAEEAFGVIYYLQEGMGIFPDHYEICRKCGAMFDSWGEGTCIDEDTEAETGKSFPKEMWGNYCDMCRPD